MTTRRGFSAMSPEKRREIAAAGGAAVPNSKRSYSRDRALAREAGRKGGMISGGNFKNDPKRAAEAGSKGGKVSRGNFAHNSARAAEAGRKGGKARKS